MRITRIFALVGVSLFILCSTAIAGDFATLNFIGFSTDGKYLAFEEHGVQDGSGFPYSQIYFVDVLKNSYAAPPVTVRIDKETASERLARSRAKLGAGAALRRLRIIEGNTGTLVVARLLTDPKAYRDSKDDGQTINFAEIMGSLYRRGDYDLVLKSSEVKGVKDCDYNDDPIRKLELVLRDNEADTTKVLQKDANLPASRGCPLSYRMQYVYIYGDNVAVFLNTYHMGFEGPDMRYMVVTGKYK
jgi:predicted secreted protein